MLSAAMVVIAAAARKRLTSMENPMVVGRRLVESIGRNRSPVGTGLRRPARIVWRMLGGCVCICSFVDPQNWFRSGHIRDHI